MCRSGGRSYDAADNAEYGRGSFIYHVVQFNGLFIFNLNSETNVTDSEFFFKFFFFYQLIMIAAGNLNNDHDTHQEIRNLI